MAEAASWSPLTLISVFGLAAVSALVYAGTTMQRIAQLETNDQRIEARMQQMVESRFEKQAEFEAKLSTLEKTDAARTEELKAIHSQLDQNAGQMKAAGIQLMDKLQGLSQQIDGLRYRSDERGSPR